MTYMQINIHDDDAREVIQSVCKPTEIEHTVVNQQVIYYATLPKLSDYQVLEEICHENGIECFFVDSEN